MGSDPQSGHSTYERTVDLVRELDALKQGGSSILVVGSDPHLAHDAACTHFLGDGTVSPRRRVFVSTDGRGHCRTRLPEPPHRPVDEYVRVVRCEATVRGATTSSPDGSTGPAARIPERSVPCTDLGALGIAVDEELGALDEASGGVEAAELRLCVDSLATLVEENGRERTFGFLHLLTSRIADYRGMGHFHLRVDRESELVYLLSPLFDAVVEVAQGERGVRQRWHLRESGLSTEWLEL